MNNLTNFTETIKQECPKGWDELEKYVDANSFRIKPDIGGAFSLELFVKYKSFEDFEGYLRGYLREKKIHIDISWEQVQIGGEWSKEYWWNIIGITIEEDWHDSIFAVLSRESYETAFLTACLEAFKYLEK